jgi:hypothetical protein
MIVMKIQGGLGNQMFQWACGRKLSLERGCPFVIDISSYNLDKKRSFQLPLFKNIQKLLSSGEIEVANLFSYGLPIIMDDFKTFSFPAEPFYMNGYWQSDKFFEGIEEIIKQDFDLTEYKYIVDDYEISNNCLSLHIRRDDYVMSNGYHPVQPLSYYSKALDIIRDYDKVLVFSDDIEWCKANLQFDKIEFVQKTNEFETIYLMSHVRNNIIANSSFSWWGAWLNSNKDKKVIAPSHWFGEVSRICADFIIPKDWIKI